MAKSEKKQKKKCNHGATYYDKKIGDFICQYCRAVIGELRMGKKKKDEKKK